MNELERHLSVLKHEFPVLTFVEDETILVLFVREQYLGFVYCNLGGFSGKKCFHNLFKDNSFVVCIEDSLDPIREVIIECLQQQV